MIQIDNYTLVNQCETNIKTICTSITNNSKLRNSKLNLFIPFIAFIITLKLSNSMNGQLRKSSLEVRRSMWVFQFCMVYSSFNTGAVYYDVQENFVLLYLENLLYYQSKGTCRKFNHQRSDNKLFCSS